VEGKKILEALLNREKKGILSLVLCREMDVNAMINRSLGELLVASRFTEIKNNWLGLSVLYI
jgi:hypothetical protein